MNYHTFVNIAIVCFIAAAAGFLVRAIGRKNGAKTFSVIVFAAGLLLIAAAMIWRGIKAGHVPMANTYETVIFMALITGIICLFLQKADKASMISFGISVIILVLLAASSFVDDAPSPLVPALKSNWLTIHVTFSFLSYAAFAAAFVISIIYLLPSKEKESNLDDLAYKCILFGFPFLTLGIVTGAEWAQRAWGAYWSWDPKETWALITWIVYGIYLHLRLQRGWKGNKSAWIAVVGFAFVMFTYFGVNYLLSGLHSYK